MKRICIALSVLAALASCQSGDTKAVKSTNDSTTIEWLDKNPMDMGTATAGQKVEVLYHFKNTATKPLVIADVSPQCGCTVPDKVEKPIAPGEEGTIRAIFNSTGYSGVASKHLTVTANTTPVNIFDLQFNVQVNPAN